MSLETRLRRLEGGEIAERFDIALHSGLQSFTAGEFRRLLREIDGRSRELRLKQAENAPAAG